MTVKQAKNGSWFTQFRCSDSDSDSAPLQLTAVKPIFGIATS